MKNIRILKTYFLFLIYKLGDIAQKIKGGLFKNAKKNVVELLFYIFIFMSIAILLGYIFGKRQEVYNLSNRIGSTEKQLEQYRKREELNIRNFKVANDKLRQINSELDKYRVDFESIRKENNTIRKQLNNAVIENERSRKYSESIGHSVDQQSNSIDRCRTIINTVQERGQITSFEK